MFVDDIGEDFNFIPRDKPDDEYSENELFNYILPKLTTDEVNTLNLLIDKKKTKGRYKADVKIKVEAMKIKLAELVNEFTDEYKHIRKASEYKSDKEIDEILNPITIKKTKRNTHQASESDDEEE